MRPCSSLKGGTSWYEILFLKSIFLLHLHSILGFSRFMPFFKPQRLEVNVRLVEKDIRVGTTINAACTTCHFWCLKVLLQKLGSLFSHAY